MMKANDILKLFVIFCLFEINIFSQGAQQTFCRNGANIPIFDNATVKDSILVNTGSGRYIFDINILIDTLVHTWVGDLTISISKNSITRLLFNQTGGSGDNFIGTVFDDSALVSINNATAPFTGRYRPVETLSEFNNSYFPNGYYVLKITDNASGDTGFLKAWCVVITTGIINGINQTIEIPNSYRLYQNYPNPFNPATKIKYGVPNNGYIKLTVYDELGKEVAVADEGYKQANTYEAVFDATNLPSGVYYYKLEAYPSISSGRKFTDTKKMVILK